MEQVIDLRLTLRYLGVPIRDRSMMFGDNESVVKSSTIPQGKLHKRHTALSFHRVREAVAAKMIAYHFLSGKETQPIASARIGRTLLCTIWLSSRYFSTLEIQEIYF